MSVNTHDTIGGQYGLRFNDIIVVFNDR